MAGGTREVSRSPTAAGDARQPADWQDHRQGESQRQPSHEQAQSRQEQTQPKQQRDPQSQQLLTNQPSDLPQQAHFATQSQQDHGQQRQHCHQEPNQLQQEEIPEVPQPVHIDLDGLVDGVYVRFTGLKRVSPHSIISEFEGMSRARTFRDLQFELEEADRRLNELRLFKSVRAEVTVEPNGNVDVEMITEEKKRECTASGNVNRKGEMAADVRINQPAVFGGPMSATATIGSTASQAREFVFSLNTPRFLGRRCAWAFDISRHGTDEAQASSFSVSSTSASMKLLDMSGSNFIAAEASLRDVHPTVGGMRLPSFEVQTARLRSLKTSVSCSLSKRFCGLGGALGATTRADFEVAGGPGDVNFLRKEMQTGVNMDLPYGARVHASGACGIVYPTDDQPVCLQDRFFLGGATGSAASVLKGFRYNGIGQMGACRARNPDDPPKRLVDALGGNAMLNAFAAISMPLQFPKEVPVGDARGFVFISAGSLVPSDPRAFAGGMLGLTHTFREQARASVGVGAGVPLGGMGSLELTFAWPVLAQATDLRQRWQLGFRLNLAS